MEYEQSESNCPEKKQHKIVPEYLKEYSKMIPQFYTPQEEDLSFPQVEIPYKDNLILIEKPNLTEEEENRIDTLLEKNKDALFIIQKDNKDSPISNKVIQFVKENKGKLKVLDSEDEIYKNLAEEWKYNRGRSREEYYYNYLRAFYYILKEMNEGKITGKDLEQEPHEEIFKTRNITQKQQVAYYNALTTIIEKGEISSTELDFYCTLMESYLIKYDSILKTRYHQEQVAKLMKQLKKGKHVVIVLDKKNCMEISCTMGDTHRKREGDKYSYRTDLSSLEQRTSLIFHKDFKTPTITFR